MDVVRKVIMPRTQALMGYFRSLNDESRRRAILSSAFFADLLFVYFFSKLIAALVGVKKAKSIQSDTVSYKTGRRSRKQIQEQGLAAVDLVRDDNGPLLLASDCDGTLFDDSGKISARTHKALRRFSAHGGTVVLATGNPSMVMRRSIKDLGCSNAFVVCSSGSVVMAADRWEPIILNAIPASSAAKLASALQAVDPEIQVAIEGLEGWYVKSDVFFDLLDACAGGMGSKIKSIAQVAPPGSSLAELFLLSGEDSAIRVLFIHATMSAEQVIEIATGVLEESEADFEDPSNNHPKIQTKPAGAKGAGYFGVANVHKASALQQVCDLLAVPSSRVIAFGDHDNDLEMLVWAGKGMAVANAVPKLKQVATKVLTNTNAQDAVAIEIEQILDASDERALMRDNLRRLNDQVGLLEAENTVLQKDNLALEGTVAQHEQFLDILRTQSPAPTPSRSLRKKLLTKTT